MGRGLEQPLLSPGKSPVPVQGGAESGAVGAQSTLVDADLRAIIEAWPELPDAVKAGILAMIHAAEGAD